MSNQLDDVPSQSLTRRFFLQAGATGMAALSSLLAACRRPSSTGATGSTAGVAGVGPLRGRKRKLVWIPQSAGDWELPIRVGQLEFCRMVGWDYQHLGNPIYSVENHMDQLDNAIAARPDIIVTELETPGMVRGFKKAMDVGITMVIIDQAVSEEAAKLGVNVINEDSLALGFLNGTQAATWAERISGKKAGIILIGNGNPGSSSLDLRQKGTQEGVAAYNRQQGTNFTTEVFADSGFDDIVVAISKYGAHLNQKGDQLVAMVGLGGGSAIAIWKMLKDRNIPPGRRIAAGAPDIFPDQQTGIEEGYLQWGIDEDFLVMGFLSAASAWLQLEHGFRCPNIHTQNELILKEGIPSVRARTENWLAKARELNLSRG